MIIGVISDTHGLLREEVINNLSNCQLIIHAGDIGNGDIIKRLEEIANTIFVYTALSVVEQIQCFIARKVKYCRAVVITMCFYRFIQQLRSFVAYIFR